MVIRPDYTVGRIVQVFLTDGPIVSLNFPEFAGGYGVADFNKDGHADVMLGNGDTNRLQLWIYLGDGRGSFARAPETRIDTSVLGLGLGDLNGDSAPDLVLICTTVSSLRTTCSSCSIGETAPSRSEAASTRPPTTTLLRRLPT